MIGAVAPLLFGSGFCALVYQVVWLREMRSIFGASTAASAAVLAIFVGGLGVGGLWLGKRAERHPSPLALYARLELAVAATAAASPLLLSVAREAYLFTGGSASLGLPLATALRLLLSTLVLAAPTVAMGGTLPAATRAAASWADERRAGFALLYAANTLGAVAGSALATFALLEAFGSRRTLWLAATMNLAVALLAMVIASRPRAASPEPPATPPVGEGELLPDGSEAPRPEGEGPSAPAPFVLGSMAVAGFVFFLMELVWYRMLGPLLGGSVFTFGLILTLALLGVGAGGAAYALLGERRPATLSGFALTCMLEAAFVALPFALGDRIAVLAVVLRPLGGMGFFGHVAGWSMIAGLVVLPSAFVSGVQFPLLLGLLGRGGRAIGRQVGLAYAWNTGGAIAGSLLGGFGLLPALSAPRCWALSSALLMALGITSAALLARRSGRLSSLALPLALAGLVGAMLLAEGPTAAWRHSPIGAGRVGPERVSSPHALRSWLRAQRAAVRREMEGVESSVGLDESSGLAFVVNGKVDGNAVYDAPTAVMLGLVGALLHPEPRRALVIGLGTGSTAGWLADVPSIERVDVAELEPSLLRVAAECGPVNRRALDNPKVHVSLGDARELTVSGAARYDLVASEPSNPYRAGVASLFTRDYYQAVRQRLAPGGLFLQWVQVYEIDVQTVRTIYATLRAVFPVVETWQLREGDLLLVGADRPIEHRASELRERASREPLRSALRDVWRADSLEDALARHVARPSFADEIALREAGRINTDDHPIVEFGFARGVAQNGRTVELDDLREAASSRGEGRPAVVGEVDWERVEDARISIPAVEGYPPRPRGIATPERWQRYLAIKRYIDGDMRGSLEAWGAQPKEPESPIELEVVAATLSDLGDERALPLLEQIQRRRPADADGLLAWLRYRQGDLPASAASLARAFIAHRDDPWVSHLIMQRAFSLSNALVVAQPSLAPGLYAALDRPFVLKALDGDRLLARLEAASSAGFRERCLAALAPLEPHAPWDGKLLRVRRDCYEATGSPLLTRAQRDLDDWARLEPEPLLR